MSTNAVGPTLHRHLGLRSAVTLSFAGGALLLSAVLSIGTYLVARDYLVEQRERSATGQAFADASYVRAGLLTESKPVSDVLGEVSPPADATVFVRQAGEWYSSSLILASDVVPPSLQSAVAAGRGGIAWTTVDNSPAIVVGVQLPAVDAEFFEVAAADELNRTLNTIAAVLAGFAALTTVGGALLGRWASRRVLAPLNAVAGAAARIAGGDMRTRLDPTDDPDLLTIVGSFNSMVDALHERIERDARFTADVAHELRSPLTTLTTSMGVLRGRQDEMSSTSRSALHLAAEDLRRFRTVLEDLLELGRLDAGGGERAAVRVNVRELVRQALITSGRPDALLDEGATSLHVAVDKQRMSRALINLFDNADIHGGGLARVRVQAVGSHVEVDVDDAGPGIPAAERARIFERFVRGGSRRSLPGAGLGLSLVAETLRGHDGGVNCTDSPAGGARFSVWLPLADRSMDS